MQAKVEMAALAAIGLVILTFISGARENQKRYVATLNCSERMCIVTSMEDGSVIEAFEEDKYDPNALYSVVVKKSAGNYTVVSANEVKAPKLFGGVMKAEGIRGTNKTTITDANGDQLVIEGACEAGQVLYGTKSGLFSYDYYCE